MTDEANAEEVRKKSVSSSGASPPSEIGQPTRNRPHCKVLLLDGGYHVIPIQKKAKGEVVINECFRHLDLKDLKEREYFSVYYVDSSDSKIFLNPFKQIRRQLPNASSRTTWELFFGVQFYATEIDMLADEITRYLYVLQMCRDIKEKRINADRSTKLQLVSLLVQANCGDYDPGQHKEGYVEAYIDMIYNPAEIPVGLPYSVTEVHKEKAGLKPSEADNGFFMIVKGLYKFGEQIFPVCDHLGQKGQIGASIVGLYFHKDGREFMNIPWEDVVTVGYRRKKLRIRYHPKGPEHENVELLYLRCTEPNAKIVWRGCVEQHTFFRLEKPAPLVSSTAKSYYSFNRNSELRFSQSKTLYQMMRAERKQQQQPEFQRSLSVRVTQQERHKAENDDVFLPGRSSARNETIRDREPEPIGLPDRTSERNVTIHNREPEPIGLPDRMSHRNETLYEKDSHITLESTDAVDDELKPRDDMTHSRQGSLELTLEAAWKQKSEENKEIEKTDPDNTDTTVTATVEINQTLEESKIDVEEEQKQNASLEIDFEHQPAANSHLMVDVMATESDGANVEFTSTDKRNSSYMVTLEETSPSPPPLDLSDSVMLEGKYRNDSIIPTELDPAVKQFMENAKQDGTVLPNVVNVEVLAPTSNHDEASAEIIDSEMNKVNHVKTSSGNDIEVAVKVETPHSDFVDM